LLKQERIKNGELEKNKLDLGQAVAVMTAKHDVLVESTAKHQAMTEQLLKELRQQQLQQKKSYEAALENLQKQYTKENTEIKEMAEDQRHKLIAEIDSLNTANQHLQRLLQQKEQNIDGLMKKIDEIGLQGQECKNNIFSIHHTIEKPNEKHIQSQEKSSINIIEQIKYMDNRIMQGAKKSELHRKESNRQTNELKRGIKQTQEIFNSFIQAIKEES